METSSKCIDATPPAEATVIIATPASINTRAPTGKNEDSHEAVTESIMEPPLHSKDNTLTLVPQIPITCVFSSQRNMFRITRNHGAKLSQGGWGVPIADNEDEDSYDDINNLQSNITIHALENNTSEEHTSMIHADDTVQTIHSPTNESSVLPALDTAATTTSTTAPTDNHVHTTTTTAITTHEYLFIEQVIFLHERGMLEACENDVSAPYSAQQLYALLEPLGVSLPAYLTYAHLCQQTYRVWRHSPHRHAILRAQEQLHAPHQSHEPHTTCSNNVPVPVQQDTHHTNMTNELNTASPTTTMPPQVRYNALYWKRRLRRNLAHSTVPPLDVTPLSLWWDVYEPSRTFPRSHPGMPDFYVAGTTLHDRTTFSDLQALLLQQSTSSIKVAVVSDSGTVLLLGVHATGVPPVTTTSSNGVGSQNASSSPSMQSDDM
jgi:hypothetical protein